MAGNTLVTGATGLLGRALMQALRKQGEAPLGASKSGTDGTIALNHANRTEILSILDQIRPARIFHLGGMTRPADCEMDRASAWAINVDATATIAQWCRDNGSWLLLTSSDWVFDGEHGPYCEDDEPRPASYYGETKLAAERHVEGVGTVARLSLLLNDVDHPRRDFRQLAIERMQRGETATGVVDEWRSPLPASAAARALLRLSELNHRGTVHIGGARAGTPMDFIREAAIEARLDPDLAVPVTRRAFTTTYRPRDVRLDARRMNALFEASPAPRKSRLGIVIPVYNGAKTLPDTLAAIAAQADPDLAVVVVVNGSSDNSAVIAEAGLARIAFTGAETHLIVLDAPSRPKALDAGDAALGAGHRLYVDQDSVLSVNAVEQVRAALDSGASFAGARASWRGGTAPVRAAMTAWSAFPYVRKSPVCAGMFAVSEAGRARLPNWPEGMPDDKFARLSFSPEERRPLDGVTYTVSAPLNFRDLVATRRRYRRWNVALANSYPELARNDLDRGVRQLSRLSPRWWPGAAILLAADRLA